MSSILKKLNEKTPDSIKYILTPFIRKKLINNNVFLKGYKEVDSFKKLCESDKDKIQFEKLKEILIHSYETTRYYKKLFDANSFNPYKFNDVDDLKKIPLDMNYMMTMISFI